MPIWICKQCSRPKPMVEFKRSKNGNYLDVCAECSPSKFKPKLPPVNPAWLAPKGFTPDFCEKCGYHRKTARKDQRCYCRGKYDRDGQLKPLRRGIDRRLWFSLSKEQMAERMRWYQSNTERRAGSAIQEIAYLYHTPYKAQHVICGYIVDFFYPKLKLVVEIDGPHHDLPQNKLADDIRTSHLQKLGLLVARISYRDLDSKGPKRALEPIRRIIESKLGKPEH